MALSVNSTHLFSFKGLKPLFIILLFALVSSIVISKVINASSTKSIPITIPISLTYPNVGEGAYEILYRGIPDTHTMSKFAEQGISKPFGGNATPLQHRDGDTRSKYTSWTRNLKIAINYATHDASGVPCDGWLLVKIFIIGDPNYIDMAGYDIFGEDEVLIKEIVKGCVPIRITSGMTFKEILTKIKAL